MTTEHTVAELRSRIDDLKVRAHLGGMETRDAWDKLSTRLEQLEHKATGGAARAATEIAETLEHLATALKDLGKRLDTSAH